jgi:hypothetical protein
MSARLAALLVIVVALGACGDGESDQERAQNQVCDARADIQKQVEEIGSASLETATLGGIRQRLEAIRADLAKIAEARADLSAERREQVQSATSRFGRDVESVIDDLGSGGSLSGALTELQNSLVELRDSYQSSLATIDCD